MPVEPLGEDLDLDREREALLEQPQGSLQAVLHQRAGMKPAGEPSQLLEPGVELSACLLQQRRGRRRIRLEPRLREPEQQCRRHQSLLRAVVEVALEPAALLVARPDDTGPRGLQVCPRLCARDRERDEVAEGGEPNLAVGGSGSGLPMETQPQSVPATMIGAETVDRQRERAVQRARPRLLPSPRPAPGAAVSRARPIEVDSSA